MPASSSQQISAFIERPRLFAALAHWPTLRLVSIVAPTGYGKVR